MLESGVLIVAATRQELTGLDGLVCGVGPVEAAITTAAALAGGRQKAVVHIGIAGGRGLPLLQTVIGTSAHYLDMSAAIPVIDEAFPDLQLVEAARSALSGALAEPIATSAAVGAARDLAEPVARVEGMEGFAVLRACAVARVPAVELRVVSNHVGQEDRSRWDIPGALERLHSDSRQVLPAIARAVAG